MEFKNENVKMSKVNAKLKLMENWKNSWKKKVESGEIWRK